MNNRGITIIELLVTIAVIGILVVALAFSYQGWIGRYRIESQTKEMYVDLMNARARAMQRNMTHFAVVNANDYQIFEDTNEDGTYNAADQQIQGFATVKTIQYTSLWTGNLTMDIKGIVSPNTTIQFDIGTNTPDYDCVVIQTTRINMGLMTGGACAER